MMTAHWNQFTVLSFMPIFTSDLNTSFTFYIFYHVDKSLFVKCHNDTVSKLCGAS